MSRFVFWALVAIVVLAPLPLAGNRPAPWSALALAVGVLLALWAVATLRRGRRRGWRAADRHLLPAAALWLLAVGWMVLQTTGPLPASWQPEALQRAQLLLQVQPQDGIGLDRGAAWHGLMRALTYGGVFLLAWEYGRSRARATAMLVAIVLAGIAYAAYGLVVELGDFRRVLWYPKQHYGDSLTSTFINRNSYATYAALGLLTVLALGFGQWRQRHRAASGDSRAPPGVLERIDRRLGLLVLAAVLLAAALVMTGSRGGVYSLAATLALAVGTLAACGLLRGRRLAAVIGLGGLAAIAVLAAAGGDLAARLESSGATLEAARGAIFRPTLAAIAERPLTGYGPGSFQGVFEATNDGALYRQGYVIDKAHNTYLELALEIGIPAALALALATASFAGLCLVALLKRRAVTFALAGSAASAMVALHAAIDFSLQMPAVAITYAALLGVCAARARRSLAGEDDS